MQAPTQILTPALPVTHLSFADLQRVPEPFFGDYVRAYLPSSAEQEVGRSPVATAVLVGRIVIAAKARAQKVRERGRVTGREGGEDGVPVLVEHVARVVVPDWVEEDAGADDMDVDAPERRELQFRYRLPHEYPEYEEFPSHLAAPEDDYSDMADSDAEEYARAQQAPEVQHHEDEGEEPDFSFPPKAGTIPSDSDYLHAMFARLRAETGRAQRAVADAERAMKDAMFGLEDAKLELEEERERWGVFLGDVERVAGREEVEALKEKVGARAGVPVEGAEREYASVPGNRWVVKRPPLTTHYRTSMVPVGIASAEASSSKPALSWSPFLKRRVEERESDAEDSVGEKEMRELVARKKAQRSRPSKTTGPLARALGMSAPRSAKGKGKGKERALPPPAPSSHEERGPRARAGSLRRILRSTSTRTG
ncbi:Glutathione-dependent formaldehyde-activating protein [Mycena kentingensis (nom. inval.)]|nr:Glutathione-dependent formaldehyde-activating protein [Mycena kentingensis (nom. inval.)]